MACWQFHPDPRLHPPRTSHHHTSAQDHPYAKSCLAKILPTALPHPIIGGAHRSLVARLLLPSSAQSASHSPADSRSGPRRSRCRMSPAPRGPVRVASTLATRNSLARTICRSCVSLCRDPSNGTGSLGACLRVHAVAPPVKHHHGRGQGGKRAREGPGEQLLCGDVRPPLAL